MKIALGSDPLGFELKEKVKQHLVETGHDVIDVGTVDINDPCLYIDVSHYVCMSIIEGKAEKGIVFCGTGMGVSIVANKHKGIYCAVVESEWAAKESRDINDANVLALGGRIFAEPLANDIVDAFINTPWCANSPEARRERLGKLLEQVYELEERHFK